MSKLPTLLVPGSLRLPADVPMPPPGTTPVEYITTWIKRRMPEYGGHAAALADRVLIVRARTGSGKSTVLPVAMFRILRNERTPERSRYRGPGVICTQPRVLTAISLAADVSATRGGQRRNPDMVVGETVGYQTGDLSDPPAAGLVYATAGVLAVQLGMQEDAEIMDKYRIIMVDEAHERSMDSDLTLMLLRNFFARNAGNPRLPFLVLASATFDPARYAAYFGVGAPNVVDVEGRAYPITEHWPAVGTDNYPAAAVETVVRIHEEHPDDPPHAADVLVFVPGADVATAVSDGLRKANARYEDGPLGPLLVLVINREVVIAQSGAYTQVFDAPDRLPLVAGRRPVRRVVIATNVAETGLTIDTLRYVVDCGWSRAREAYVPWAAEGIVTRPAPQSRIEQRKGRAGRLFPGDFYPLYTRAVHATLDAAQLPDIFTSGYSAHHLAVVREQHRQKLRLGETPEFRAEDIALLDPPPPEALIAANADAVALGFVAPRAPLPDRWPPDPLAAAAAPPLTVARGYGLTPVGFVAAQFSRTSMEGVRVLLAGYVWGAAASDLATAVAAFGSDPGTLLSRAELRGARGSMPPGARALRDALPTFMVVRSGGGAAVPPSDSEAFYYRAKLLIADDFAETVLVFDAFARRLDAAAGDLGAVRTWCDSVGLSLAALLKLAKQRDLIMSEMVAAGLNPFRADSRRLAALPVDDFTAGLGRLKRCLYDGLRGKALRAGPDGYVSREGLRVAVPSGLTDAMADRLRALGVTRQDVADLRPQWVVTDRVRLVPARQRPGEAAPPMMYNVSAGLVSVLDGFVSPDPEFGTARTFAG